MAPSPSVSSSGITVDETTGERHIPSSTRADGSKRREIRIRPGYRPPEDVEVYKNRSAEAWKNRGKGGIPGSEGLKSNVEDSTAKTSTNASNKNAKKREAKRKAKASENTPTAEDSQTKISSTSTTKKAEESLAKENWRPGPPNQQQGEPPVDMEAENEKKARNLKKKLKQARDLRDKKDHGENLLPEQFEKVIRIQELIRQLDNLGFDSEGEKKQKDDAV